MKLNQWLPLSAGICSLMLLPLTGYGADKSSSGEGMKKDKQSQASPDRGEPGKPGVESQPGTIFGGPATEPPAKQSPGYEGADKDQKGKPSTEGGPRN